MSHVLSQFCGDMQYICLVFDISLRVDFLLHPFTRLQAGTPWRRLSFRSAQGAQVLSAFLFWSYVPFSFLLSFFVLFVYRCLLSSSLRFSCLLSRWTLCVFLVSAVLCLTFSRCWWWKTAVCAKVPAPAYGISRFPFVRSGVMLVWCSTN